jgi:hypothetical protein
VRSLFGKWRECDRCLGSWRGAIAVWGVGGVRSLFGELEECDRCLGRLRECDRSFSVSSVSLWFVKKDVGKLRGCDRCLEG